VLGRDYENLNCSIARALERVGERWTLLILRDACLRDVRRFSDFQRSLGIARNILATRLRQLCADGLLERRVENGHPDRVEYHPTPQALDLYTGLAALMQWGDRYLAPNGPPALIEHAGCGGAAVVSVTCAGCGAELRSGDLHGRRGPGG
jgi:DNA-binding HxlR family transcriptional regulator